MIESIIRGSRKQGEPRLLVLGAVHGLEKCGTAAIQRVIKEIDAGIIELKYGTVTFVPITNPQAYEKNVRFVDDNLNRFLVPTYPPKSYEDRIRNELCPMLKKCDYLLDLHSSKSKGPPFVLVGKNDVKGYEFAANLGDHPMLTGFADAYKASSREVTAPPEEATGTTEYARRFGATSVTLECGQNNDPKADEVAYQGIRNALDYLGMTEGLRHSKKANDLSQVVTVEHVFYREDEGGGFAKDWRQLDQVVKDEILARTGKGQEIRAPTDGFVIFPDAKTPLGEEWFLFGTAGKAQLTPR